MQIAVTGATSNIGAEVALTLRERGHEVRAIALPGLPRDHLDRAGIPLTFADVTDEAALGPALDSSAAVVHCAGLVDFHPRRKDRVYRVNVDGARNCARAARRAGARHLVHISSVSVYGLIYGRVRVDEATPLMTSGIAYNDSKREGEAAVHAEAGALAVTVLRPVGIYGRYDRAFIPPSIRTLRSGTYAYLGDRTRPVNFIDARYLAEAIARLLERPPPAAPQSFIASEGPPPSSRRIAEMIADELGVPHPSRALPERAVRALGWLMDGLQMAGMSPPLGLSGGLLANALVDAVFDGGALRRHLGLTEVDPIDGIRGVVREIVRDGRLPR